METDWLLYADTGSEDVDIKHEPLEPDADYYVSFSIAEYILSIKVVYTLLLAQTAVLSAA